MTYHPLTENFKSFFKNLNPSASFEQVASREYDSIKGLVEDKFGLGAELSPQCFLQGSYKQETAIYTINDVDIIALWELWYPGSGTGKGWDRDDIFNTIAAPLLNDGRYKGKVRYSQGSMCIKVDLGIKVEILPVVFKVGNYDPRKEPFCLYRPGKRSWEDGYARDHQSYLTQKNQSPRVRGNLIPGIKVLKHLRSRFGLNAVSFHIECLLYALPDNVFAAAPADTINSILTFIGSYSAEAWFNQSELRTPCGERSVFSSSEWPWESWRKFHEAVVMWGQIASLACNSVYLNAALDHWQKLLGSDFFPRDVR